MTDSVIDQLGEDATRMKQKLKDLWRLSNNYFSTIEKLHGIHPTWAQVDKAT